MDLETLQEVFRYGLKRDRALSLRLAKSNVLIPQEELDGLIVFARSLSSVEPRPLSARL